ncbi:MAG: DUF5667 domain-containing protein [Actinomycetota bacterium]|nr:DUF5667 domain-containing protein [Actinomycetota bacterium]
MRKYDMLDRTLAGEPVAATDDVLELAELAEEIEAIFSGAEPTVPASRRGMEAALDAFRESGSRHVVPRHVVPSRTRRILARGLVAAAMLVAVQSVGWAASENAMPGDLLYPVKRAFEQFRLVVASSPAAEATIQLDIAAERLGEAARARVLGLEEAVETAVAGYADAMDGVQGSIAAARSERIDVSALLALARGLVERHDQLLEALLRDGTPAGTIPVAGANPGRADGDQGQSGRAHGHGKGKGKANGEDGGSGDRSRDRDGRADGRKHAKERDGAAGPVVPPPVADGPGRAEDAPAGEATGHEKNGPPPHGDARGPGEIAEPPPL